MTEQEAPTGPGDDELIAAVRSGDLSSFGLLFSRHQDAAHRLARQLTRGGADADDLVAGAFEKVMDQLRAGKGPDVAFRAYLLTAMRRLHVDGLRAGAKVRPSEDADLDRGVDFDDAPLAAFEQGTAAAAFASLPERWQTVLWHLDVEGEKPAAVAPILGMSANSVSALAYRAREGLRQAYLQQHLREEADDAHQWAIGNLGAYVRSGLSRRDSAKVRDHLDGCARCTAVYLELSEVNSDLGALVGPAVLGAAAAGYLGLGGSKALAVLGGWWASTRGWVAGSTTNTVAAVAGVAAVATLAGGLVVVAVTGGSDDVASAPSSQSRGSSDDSSDPGAQAPGATPVLPGATPSPSALPPRLPAAAPPAAGQPSGTTGQDDPGTDPDQDQVDPGLPDPSTDPDTRGDPVVVPDGLGASARVRASVGSTSITVDWDAVPRATGYRVYRLADTSVGGGMTAGARAALAQLVYTGPADVTETTDEPDDAGDYVYTVRAVREDAEGPSQASTASGWAGRISDDGSVATRVTAGGTPRCLGVTGERLDLVECPGSKVVVRGGTIRVDGACATASEGSVVVRPCAGTRAQRWTVQKAPQGGSRLVSDGGQVVRAVGDSLVLADPTPDTRRAKVTLPERFSLPGTTGGDAGADEPQAPLEAPGAPDVEVDGRTVTVTWTAVDDPDGYVVRRDGDVVAAGIGRDTTSYTDRSVPVGPHDYTVTAVRDDDTARSSTTLATVGLVRSGVLRFHDTYAGGPFCVDAGDGVVVRSCDDATSWSLYADDTIRTGRQCLLAAGREVSVGSCDSPTAWRPSDAPRFGGSFLLTSAGTALDASGGTVRDGIALIAFPVKRDATSASGNDNQRFTLPASEAAALRR